MTKTKSNKQNGCEETEKQRKHQGGCEAAVVSVVEPNATSKTDKATKAVMMKLIVPELQMHFPSYVIGSIALVSSSLSNSALPKALGNVLDASSSTSKDSSYSFIQSPLLMIILGGGISSFVRTICFKRIQQKIVNRLRKQIFRSLLLDPKRSIEYFDHANEEDSSMSTSSSSMLQTILTTDVETVAKCLTTNITSTIRSMNSILYSIVLMYQTSPILLGISTTVVPLIGGTSLLLMKYTKSLTRKQQQMEGIASSFAQERINHIYTVKTCAREEEEVDVYCDFVDQSSRTSNKIALMEGFFMGGIFALTSATILSVFYVGGRAVSRGEMTQGKLTSFVTYSFLLGIGTSGFFKSVSDIHRGITTSAERIYNVLYNCSTTKQMATDMEVANYDLKHCKGNVQLTNVSFAYANSPNTFVLQNCTLSVPPFTVVALVGKNGSGKTTIASLLSGLYSPQVGSVTLDGIPLTSMARKDVAKWISIVPQQPVLFASTIAENICYSNPTATTEQIIRATDMANATAFIDTLAGGFEYNVGKDGCRLSGGQRQRIALARALLNKPAVLVLDEPTSQLDVEGESAVEDAVRACRASGTSLLLITHHVKTLAVADFVAVLQDGKVVETGKFEDLKQRSEGSLLKLMPDLL